MGSNAILEIKPGRLIKRGETLTFLSTAAGKLRLCRGAAADFAEIETMSLAAGVPWTYHPVEAGMYWVELQVEGQRLQRSIAVVEQGWSVCQITVGAITAEDFAETIHNAGLSADYYIIPQKPGGRPEFSFSDQRWVGYEREFGDAIYPHMMANNFGALEPSLAHEDANWETLPMEGILDRLQFLQEWWVRHGFAPLNRIASYTPCNRFVEALKRCGIRILHSLVPEQNWSDGAWAINHWGMPNCPFWVAPDDFRKAGERTPDGVLGVTMNHYHVLIPHMTMWGDFVLSPSHFTRWIRAADSGDESTRYRQFLRDTVSNWTSPTGEPFFFVAGYEFGRTFGTSNMTPYNQRGLEALINLARTEKLVFATGPDVLAYYDRHQLRHPESAFRQRDYWVGVTVNSKPGQVGESVALERRDYKAVIREGEWLPYFHYDYRVNWSFGTCDQNAPHDFAQEDRQQLQVRVVGENLEVEAHQPLARAIPLAVWDASVTKAGAFQIIPMPSRENERKVVALEIPSGWFGRQTIALNPAPVPCIRRDDIWKMETFGEGTERHTYLHLDAPLIRNVSVPVELKKQVCVDSATGTLGKQGPGVLNLEFGMLQGWYRFWQCGIEDIEPDPAVEQKLAGSVLSSNGKSELETHYDGLHQRATQRLLPGETIVYQIDCGAELPLGTRSRALNFDRGTVAHPTLHAHEKADGVIAFGPGRSFWYHPRHLSIRIDGFPSGQAGHRWKVLLHSFDALGLDARYKVFVASREVGRWDVPEDPCSAEAFFEIEVASTDIRDSGSLEIVIHADQTPLVHWWKDRGFIAALHALWVIEG